MPKLKSHKGLLKRVRITAKGKVKYNRSGKGHLLSHKTGNKRRDLAARRWPRAAIFLASKPCCTGASRRATSKQMCDVVMCDVRASFDASDIAHRTSDITRICESGLQASG